MSMEPTLQTLPEDRPVLEELKRREPVFHRPEFSGSRAALAAQVADGLLGGRRLGPPLQP